MCAVGLRRTAAASRAAALAATAQLKLGRDAEAFVGVVDFYRLGLLQKRAVHDELEAAGLVDRILIANRVQGHGQLLAAAALGEKNTDGFDIHGFEVRADRLDGGLGDVDHGARVPFQWL
ncbi:hypothetical protein DESC_590026 [Desulfosarcina cetonica]|nr:hypothetical protein DESC_590026 [Desulfosarcina cetonica]